MPALSRGFDADAAGRRMAAWMRELFPVCRSITGDGVRRSLRRLGREIPLELREAPSGAAVFDWTVPREWNVRDAWIRDPEGERVVDLQRSTLHLVSYSVPVRATLSLEELRQHLHTLPERPGTIPYRTSYYRERWGFCLAHDRLRELPEGEYEVLVDSTLGPGSLTWGEAFLPGEEEDEVLVSTHVCHPSMANDNLSGMVVATELARHLSSRPRRLSYRFLFIPGTIGSITWLARNRERTGRIRHGLVAAGLGSPGGFHYKRSRRGDAEVDRAVVAAFQQAGARLEVEDFVPFGYDERQYCSPGFDLPVGSLTRTPWGRYPEYHTSADDLTFVQASALGEAALRYLQVFEVLESGEIPAAATETRKSPRPGRRFLNLNPHCEPQLGRRGLYRSLGGGEEGRDRELALLWVLNLSDGGYSLADVTARSGLPRERIEEAAAALEEAELLRALD